MSVPRRRFDPLHPPPDTRRRSTVVFGEEGGYAYVTVKTEVTVIIHDPADVDALDLAGLLPSARALPSVPDDQPESAPDTMEWSR